MGTLARFVPQRKDIEEVLIAAYQPPPEACSVSAALDRVSLPMEEPRPRPVGRPRKRAAKRPVARNFRMAWCGTVTLHDAEGRALHTIRYGLMPAGDPVELVTSMAGDVAKLLERRPTCVLQGSLMVPMTSGSCWRRGSMRRYSA
jgi:hypothetical protein